MASLVNGCSANAPVKTPEIVFTSAIRSRSERFAVDSMYFSTACFCAGVVILATKSCSGAKVMNVTPKIVSGLVVKTEILSSEFCNLKSTIAPTDFPIQFRCDSFIDSLQSISFKPSKRRSAYAEIRIDHCVIFFRITG